MTIVSQFTGKVHETLCLTPSVPPDIFPGLVNLAAFLLDRNYPLRARGKILDYAAREGTIEGCGLLHPKHAATAEAAYVNGMTEVPLDSPAWGSPAGREFFGKLLDDCWLPNDVIRLDVDELLPADVADFESWLDSVDAADFPAPALETV